MLSNLLGSLTLLAAATISGVKAVDFNWDIVNANLAPDGFQRSTVVVNGQFPGPLISVNKGDTVNVCPRLLLASLLGTPSPSFFSL
jgi:iron transport multicopper oxidase